MALAASPAQLGLRRQAWIKPVSSRPVAFKRNTACVSVKHWPKALQRPRSSAERTARMPVQGISNWLGLNEFERGLLAEVIPLYLFVLGVIAFAIWATFF